MQFVILGKNLQQVLNIMKKNTFITAHAEGNPKETGSVWFCGVLVLSGCSVGVFGYIGCSRDMTFRNLTYFPSVNQKKSFISFVNVKLMLAKLLLS